MAGIFDVFGSMLDFGYRPRLQEQRKAALDAMVRENSAPMAGARPMSEILTAYGEANPGAWSDAGFKSMVANARQVEGDMLAQTARERALANEEQIAGVKQGAAMYAPGMPGEGGAPITPEQSARYRAEILSNAPSGTPTEQAGYTLLGKVVSGEQAQAAAATASDEAEARRQLDVDQAEKVATTLYNRQRAASAEDHARNVAEAAAKVKELPEATRIQAAAKTQLADEMDRYAAKAEQYGFPKIGPKARELDSDRQAIRARLGLELFGSTTTKQQEEALDNMIPDHNQLINTDWNKTTFKRNLENLSDNQREHVAKLLKTPFERRNKVGRTVNIPYPK
jgi:hypothetical protein